MDNESKSYQTQIYQGYIYIYNILKVKVDDKKITHFVHISRLYLYVFEFADII